MNTVVVVEVKQEEDIKVEVKQEEVRVVVQPVEVSIETATLIPTGSIQDIDIIDGGNW